MQHISQLLAARGAALEAAAAWSAVEVNELSSLDEQPADDDSRDSSPPPPERAPAWLTGDYDLEDAMAAMELSLPRVSVCRALPDRRWALCSHICRLLLMPLSALRQCSVCLAFVSSAVSAVRPCLSYCNLAYLDFLRPPDLITQLAPAHVEWSDECVSQSEKTEEEEQENP